MADCNDLEEVGLMEMQISLMAYSKVVMKLMFDMVPKGVYMMLIEQVSMHSLDSGHAASTNTARPFEEPY